MKTIRKIYIGDNILEIKKPTSTNWFGNNNYSNGFQGFYHLVRSFNSLLHKDLIHIFGAGSLFWGIDTPNISGDDNG